MKSILLRGTCPVPLASYLKALGILRLVAEQKDASAVGWWEGEHFVLKSTLDQNQLVNFFLHEYEPTPIISPWNGRAGFLEGDDTKDSTRKGAVILKEILASKADRLTRYREIYERIAHLPIIAKLNQVRTCIKTLEKKKKDSGDVSEEEKQILSEYKKREKTIKNSLLKSLRNSLPEEFLPWMDACLAVTDKLYPSPLLGSGGNEGSMDFSINHVEAILGLFSPEDGSPNEYADRWISHALFGDYALLSSDCSPGFLSPASVGGANMGVGFQGNSLENPWNTILMLEGVVLLNAIITRRHGATSGPSLSFPFTLDPSYSTRSISPDESARPEFWAPLWKSPLTYEELKNLLKESRLQIGARLARNGLDAIRATTTLGVDRGITSFQRFGIYERRGQGYYVSAALGRVTVKRNLDTDLITHLEQGGFLQRILRLVRNDDVPGRLRRFSYQFEQTLFKLAEKGDPWQVQHCIVTYGEVVSSLESLARRDDKPPVPPRLGTDWVLRADDGSAEFRIAAAIAGIGQNRGSDPPLACHLLPLGFDAKGWQWRPDSPERVWRDGDLSSGLSSVAQWRCLEASRLQDYPPKPFASPAGVGAGALAAWLHGTLPGHADQRIAELARGLALCRIPHLPVRNPPVQHGGVLPAAWYALRAFFAPDDLLVEVGLLPLDGRLPLDARLLQLLLADRIDAAVRLAWHRLAARGAMLPPFNIQHPPALAGDFSGRRLLASLIVPLHPADLKRGFRSLLRARAGIPDQETMEEIS